MIEKANKEYKSKGNHMFFEKTDARDFFSYAKPKSYDVIVFSFSWKYFDKNVFATMYSLLKDDGKILIINDIKSNYQQLLEHFEEYKKENQNALVKINPYTYAPHNMKEFEKLLNGIGFRQTIFFPLEKNISSQSEYLLSSGILKELFLEFGTVNTVHQKKFLDSLSEKKYILPFQKFFICIAKK